MKKKTIELSEGLEVTVLKLPLGRYEQVLEVLETAQGLMDEIFEMGDITRKKLWLQLPTLIRKFYPQFLAIIPIATEKLSPKKVKEELYMDDLVHIIQVFLELNNFEAVKKRVQSLTANLKGRKPKKTN